MSTAETAPPGGARHRPGRDSIRLDPAAPLRVFRPAPRLALTVVSLAWLRAAGPEARARLEARHLTPAEASYADVLTLPRRRQEWLAGRMALKYAVRAHARHTGRTPVAYDDVRVTRVAEGMRAGKPTTDLPVEVSLTHSGDYAVALCGSGPVGVDLERPRSFPPELVRILLYDDTTAGADLAARRRLHAMPLPLRWTCKEAVLKCYGFGLRVDTREVRLTGWHEDGRFAWQAGPGLLRHVPASRTRLRTWARELDGYHLALVWE